MEITQIGMLFFPAAVGGVERVVEDLARELSLRGHEVLVYGREAYLRDTPPPIFARSIVTGGLNGKHLDAITHTATACGDVLRRGADVVHIHCPGPALMAWLPALAGLPVVLTIHAPDWQRQKWSLPARVMLRAGLRIGMHTARRVTAVSEGLATDLAETFHRPVVCIPNAVPHPATPDADVLDRLGLEAESYALHVGRIVPEKRLLLLLEAWKQADLSIPLVIAGEDTEASYARRCRAEAPAGVRFVGPRLDGQLAALYASATMVIQPSILEGASLVLLEAAARGRCVLCCEIPANREVLGETGIYFSPEDPSSLARQIVRWYKQKAQRKTQGLGAQRRVLEQFAISRTARTYEQVYRDVCDKETGKDSRI